MPVFFAFFLVCSTLFSGVQVFNEHMEPKNIGLFEHTCKGIEITVVPVCRKVIEKEIK